MLMPRHPYRRGATHPTRHDRRHGEKYRNDAAEHRDRQPRRWYGAHSRTPEVRIPGQDVHLRRGSGGGVGRDGASVRLHVPHGGVGPRVSHAGVPRRLWLAMSVATLWSLNVGSHAGDEAPSISECRRLEDGRIIRQHALVWVGMPAIRCGAADDLPRHSLHLFRPEPLPIFTRLERHEPA